MKNKIVITGAGSDIGRAIFWELHHLQLGDRYLLHCFRNLAALEPIKENARGSDIQIVHANFIQENSLKEFLACLGDDSP